MALTVYKSSAGSGKTFRLVREYIKLLIKRPEDYQHILAITFTNKATEEMKSRILDTLKMIINQSEPSYIEELSFELGADFQLEKITRNAKEAYELIIHNYSRFEVSTIDSFFSRVLRSFARELDLPLSYEVEMNQDMVLKESIHLLFRSLDEEKAVKQWLANYSLDRMEEEKSWNIEGGLTKIGENLFKESFQKALDSEEWDLEAYAELIDNLKKRVKLFKNTLAKLANDALDLIQQNELHVADFNRGANGFAKKFVDLTKGEINLTDTFKKTMRGESSWFAKSSSKKEQIESALLNGLQDKGFELIEYYEKELVEYNSAQVLLKNIYAYGVLEVLSQQLKNYRDEQNVMLISDTNFILKDILDQADAPFMFEKLGSYFKHIMIDEFQDTSNYQWKNLEALIINSLSEDHEVLIVGDVKQSIYRFRGGNMRLLLSEIKQDLGAFYTKEADRNLEDNWRSKRAIVEFNNALFEKLPSKLNDNDLLANSNLFQEAFKGHHQNVRGGEGGFVRTTFYDRGDWQERALDQLVKNVRYNLELGYTLKDILILVNQNSQITEIAERLLAQNWRIVNNDTLLLANSPLVRFILLTLQFLDSSKDELRNIALIYAYHQLIGTSSEVLAKPKEGRLTLEEAGFPAEFTQRMTALKQLGLYDLIAELLLVFDLKEQTDVYLQQFLDVVLEQSGKGVNSIDSFLDWWNINGEKQAVATSQSTDAITIMSIHKSKGLEAPIVMIPFASWSILPNANMHQYWTEDVPEHYYPLRFAPLDFNTVLKDSYFADSYYQEAEEGSLDILNKTYVALTRPREKLYISAPRGKNIGSSTISDLLFKTLSEMDLNYEEADLEWVFSKGDDRGTADDKPMVRAEQIRTYPESSFIQKLNIRNDSSRFFMLQETESAQNINLGNQVHEVLASIKVREDLPSVIMQLKQAGEISQSSIAEIENKVKVLLQNEQVQEWFSGDYEVFNEREIWFKGKVAKPDRLMTKGSSAIIVDYKKEVESEKHLSQVKHYMQVMETLGYDAVQGYLVYMDSLNVKEVTK